MNETKSVDLPELGALRGPRGSGLALSALKGLAPNTNQGAGSIGPPVGAVGPQLELDE